MRGHGLRDWDLHVPNGKTKIDTFGFFGGLPRFVERVSQTMPST